MNLVVNFPLSAWGSRMPGMMVVLLLVVGCGICSGQDVGMPNQTEDEKSIRKAVASYVDAFNRQDAPKVAGHWSPEAVYVTPIDGRRVIGRKAIEAQFASLFDTAKGLKINVVVDSIQFVSPNVAVEQGQATFIRPDAAVQVTGYSAVHVRRDGAWLLDRVEEKVVEVPESNYQHLKGLEWLVGVWVDEDQAGRIETVCHWTKNQNFLHRAFTVSDQQGVHLSGMQIIGWDAVEERVRSWTFDSDGGFATGIWSADENDAKEPESWHVRKKGHTASGHTTSAVNVLTRRGEAAFAFKSVSRTFDGQILPNIAEVTVTRQ